MTVLHVDMDAFFASVEQRDHPEWRGKPVVVGSGPHERGVVSTCSYEARKYGIRSAMPSRTAYSLCPSAIFVKPRMEAYAEASRKAFEIFGSYSPFVEHVSVDEAFLDITGTIHLFGDEAALGARLRADIRRTLGLTCSVGIAPNRLLAKLASESAKPDGLAIAPFDQEGIRAWLAPKPVGDLWGVGRKTAELLSRYGFRTCGDLQAADSRLLERALGRAAAESVMAHALGRDSSQVAWEGREEKSVSREHTFAEDESDRARVRDTLLRLVCEVGLRFRRERRWARTGRIKLRDAAFATVTRQAHFDFPARDDMTFRRLMLSLFDREWPEGVCRTVRLVGFGVTDIVSSPPASDSLFPTPQEADRERRERLSEALDALHASGRGKICYTASGL